MATQICPNCKTDSFIWTIDDELPLTKWHCHTCGYSAFEDETLERECSACKTKTEIKLDDGKKIYWWCSSCDSIINIRIL